MIQFNEIEYASHTDVGIKRSHNQDSHVVMPAKDDEHWREVGHVFLVADGMGAHAVGELASKIAVDNIPHIYSKHAQHGAQPALRRAFQEANSIIHTRGQQNREFEGMGTTGVSLVIRPEGAWVGHVGDSRVYRVRGGIIDQLSFDHSLLWELARRQHKNPDELTGIPSNVIVRSLGPEANVEVDVEGPHPLEKGDAFLLCSDGLSGLVSDRVIGAVVTALPPEEAVRFLVHMANLQGGLDNTTVIVVRVGGAPTLKSDSKTDVVFPAAGAPNPTAARLALLRHQLARVPWMFVLLSLGIVMAGIAIVLQVAVHPALAMYAFLASGALLLGGIAALIVPFLGLARIAPAEGSAAEPRLHVYRQTTCPLDAAMYEKLLQSTKSLEENIKDKSWQYDARAYQEHLRQGASYAKQQRPWDAFRAQCRAMLVLMEAVHAYRGKNEDFKPKWDWPTAG